MKRECEDSYYFCLSCYIHVNNFLTVIDAVFITTLVACSTERHDDDLKYSTDFYVIPFSFDGNVNTFRLHIRIDLRHFRSVTCRTQ